eukprot:CAMPEP_0116876574 /NCGR_PEP_ID=MMETSP0463-20121206/8484_1 /TAXON_ID=181622 /ORGANISM="Strombidinopsis sp, Strain SopsisLIS2011" /LENGTH=86 /DNA_ID=CAMNT_0004523251 /DNA_START=130 /DNA_END=390 /DNA_ORIENTATION=+
MDTNNASSASEAALAVSKVKRKQIFKKTKAKDYKKKIEELRLASKKLKKRNIDQKAEKRRIAHEIKELKKFIKKSSDKVDEESDSE